MLKAVIFDVDNTLVDFWKMKDSTIDAAVTAMIDAGLEMGRKDAKDLMFELYKKFGLEYEHIFEKFLKKVMGKVDCRILAHGINAYRKVRPDVMRPYPGVKKTLLKLKERGFLLGIVSDAPCLKVWLRLVAMGLDGLFDCVVCYEDTKKIKPDTSPFNKALKMMKLEPEEVLMVGDNPSRDIVGAKRVGMVTCFARYGYVDKFSGKISTKANFEINKIEELLDILF